MAARADPEALDRKAESDLLVDLAPACRGLHRRAVRHRGRSPRVAGAARRAGAALFGQAPVRAAPRGQGDQGSRCGAAQRPQAGAGTGHADRRRSRPISRHAPACSPGNCAMPRRWRAGSTTRPRTSCRCAPRCEYAAWATLTPAGRGRAQARPAVPRAAPARHASPRAGRDRRAARRHDAAPARGRLAAARRVRADRSRHRPRRRARPGELLHLVPQPAEGQLPLGPAREGRQLPQKRVRGDAGRLPARRENLRDEHRQGARQQRSARWRSSRSTTRSAPRPGTASATTA